MGLFTERRSTPVACSSPLFNFVQNEGLGDQLEGLGDQLEGLGDRDIPSILLQVLIDTITILSDD